MEGAFKAKRLGNSELVLRNVFIRAAAYEGMCPGGIPGQQLTDHHVAMARGGVGLTTVSYGAVSPDGRTFKEQMMLDEYRLRLLRDLVRQVHEAGGKVSIQLTHCGYFSKNVEYPRPLAPSRVFNEYGSLSGIFFSREMTPAHMDRIRADFARAAVGARDAGFDAVEVHMGHGYLLSQFLSPLTNKRRNAYGGSTANRARFPLEVFESVREAVGGTFPVLVKLNLSDGKRKGFHLDECIYVAKELEKRGCTALELSGGFTSKTPFYLMRGKVPLLGMIRNGESVAEKVTMALFGPLIIRKYPFKENFFLDQAREVRKSVDMPLVYLGGVDSRKGMEEVLEAGFDFIAMARALIHDPGFLLKIRDGLIERTECNRCNRCVVEMDRDGVRCVL
jgi:2,4-dienoyl-CoA reductase-like NADH-dependent reductase (Old Yellow Enzyme family)